MQYVALCLEPPGNIARELSLYRRSLFHESAESSSLAFPDLVLLAWARTSLGKPASLGSPVILRNVLSATWEGIEGPFSSTSIQSWGACLFLGLAGPVSALCRAACSAIERLGLEHEQTPPFQAGLGFFIMRREHGLLRPELPALSAPPRLSFLDCHIALLRFDIGADPFSAARWEYRARVRRRTGP